MAAVAASAAVAAPSLAAESPTAVTVTAPDATNVITVADVQHWVRVARVEADAAPRREVERAALEWVVGAAWIEGEAREQRIAVSDVEVSAQTERQIRQSFPRRAAFRRFLHRTHQTPADIHERVRVDMLSNRIHDRIVASASAVTDADVDAALAVARPEWMPETRDIRVVLTRTRAAGRAARAALASGRSWRAVARRYSIDDATRMHGGLLPAQAKGTLDRRLDRAVFGVRRGRLHGPIRTQYGYYVFEVVRIHPRRPVPHARRRAEIRAKLVGEAQQKALDDFVKAFTAKWKARTVCAPAYTWDSDCGNAAY